jgi:hypothetical protein
MSVRHVSKAGSDSADGTTEATAWLTVQYAADHADAGTTVYVHEGTYTEQVLFTSGGNAVEGPVTFVTSGYVELVGTGYSDGIVFKACGYINLKNFVITNDGGDGSTTLTTGVNIKQDTSQTGLGAHHIKLIGCKFKDCNHSKATGYTYSVLIGAVTDDRVGGTRVTDVEVRECDFFPGLFNSTVPVYGSHIGVTAAATDVGIIGCGFYSSAALPCQGIQTGGNTGGVNCFPDTQSRLVVSDNRFYGSGVAANEEAYALYTTGNYDVLFERNKVYDWTFALGVFTEKGDASGILSTRTWVRRNLVLRSTSAALLTGAWATTYAPVVSLAVTNNTMVRTTAPLVPFGYGLVKIPADGDDTTPLLGRTSVRGNVFVSEGDLLEASATGLATGVFDGNYWVSPGATPFVWEDGSASGFPYDADQDDAGAFSATSHRLFNADYLPKTGFASTNGADYTPDWYQPGCFGVYEPEAELDVYGNPVVVRYVGAVCGSNPNKSV